MQSAFLNKRQVIELIEKGELIIEPLLSKEQITTVGIDVRLDSIFREFAISEIGLFDIAEDIQENQVYHVRSKKISKRSDGKGLEIEPIIIQGGDFLLAQTLEYICLPENLVGFLDGRSSLARRGIIVHATAGSIEPGFRGHIALEIGNIGKIPVKIYPLMRIANLHLARVESTEGYKGQFWGQVRLKTPKPDVDLRKLLGRGG